MSDLFRNKNILVISPQSWGKMRVSKHHYAIELAKRGNNVFFLNPPSDDHAELFHVVEHDEIQNLRIVSYKPFFSYLLRFHCRWLFDLLMILQIRILLQKLNDKIDILWNFDFNLYSNLKAFNADTIIYHVVDQISGNHSIKAAYDADIIVSVASEILEKFNSVPQRKVLINHGLAEAFVNMAKIRLQHNDFGQTCTDRPQIGYVGNLFIGHLDREKVKELIKENRNVDFHFWGSYEAKDCNIAGNFSQVSYDFIRFLHDMPNVNLRGPREPDAVAKEIQEMDAFLICYDLSKDPNNGSNCHKMLEYLSTGKVVISNKITAYNNYKHLIQMDDTLVKNDICRLFHETVQNLQFYNGMELQKERIALAISNTYTLQIERIEFALGIK